MPSCEALNAVSPTGPTCKTTVSKDKREDIQEGLYFLVESFRSPLRAFYNDDLENAV
jgi:hypothetical protein